MISFFITETPITRGSAEIHGLTGQVAWIAAQICCIALSYSDPNEKLTTFPALCSVAPWCPTLCSPMDCSLPGSSVHGISKHEYCYFLPNPGIEYMSPVWKEDFFYHWACLMYRNTQKLRGWQDNRTAYWKHSWGANSEKLPAKSHAPGYGTYFKSMMFPWVVCP